MSAREWPEPRPAPIFPTTWRVVIAVTVCDIKSDITYKWEVLRDSEMDLLGNDTNNTWATRRCIHTKPKYTSLRAQCQVTVTATDEMGNHKISELRKTSRTALQTSTPHHKREMHDIKLIHTQNRAELAEVASHWPSFPLSLGCFQIFQIFWPPTSPLNILWEKMSIFHPIMSVFFF